MSLEFCVGIGARPDINLIADLSRTIDENGFTYMTLLDAPSKTIDVHLMMAVAAQNTTQVKLGQGVVDPVTYHPLTLANIAASIQQIAGDRVFIGIGTGNPMSKGRPRAKLQDMRDAAAFIRGYMAGKEVEYNGARMRSDWLKKPVPIYMSAHGPKALQVAGEIADGVIFLCIHPVYVKWQLELIARGAERVGRDPATIDNWARCMIYVTPDKKDAFRETSAYPSSYAGLWRVLTRDLPEVEDLRARMEKAEPGLVDELVRDTKKYSELLNPREGERLDAPHSRVVTWRMIDFFHFTGKEEGIIAQMEELSEIGVKGISMTTYTLVEKIGMVKEVGSKIVPHFKK